jgi:polysaccharide pyruvyl transferase CsaB
VKTMIFAQGIGPLIRPAARKWTARVLSQVDAITVRDADSAELLREIGVGAKGTPEIEVTADPVFALAPDLTERVSAQALQRPVIGVSLRPWPGTDRVVATLAEALSRFEGRVSLQGWPLYTREDTPICQSLAERLPSLTVMTEELTPGEWMALAGWTDVVVGMRLHALIFGAARAVPVVGVSYDPKVDALLQRLRSRPVGTTESLDAGEIVCAIEAALDDDETRRRDREARAEHLRGAAFRNVDRALELLP